MNKMFRVFSACNGIGCLYQALKELGITNIEFISSEIDEKANMVMKKRHPDTIFMGDISQITGKMLGFIDFFGAGSPCKNLSVAGNKKGLSTKCGIPILTYEDYEYYKSMGYKFTDSCVFWECIRIFRELLVINPNMMFLFENVTNKDWEWVMSNAIGRKPIPINSKYFIGQNRNRNYWTNLLVNEYDKVIQPISLIIPTAETGGGWSGRQFKETGDEWVQTYSRRKDKVANCITTWPSTEWRPGRRFYEDIHRNIFPLTIGHLEQLQGLPIGYTDIPGITEDDRIRMLGNCWTVPVIAHLLKNLKEELVYSY
jgi:site-specific DNA-cytosine methylase